MSIFFLRTKQAGVELKDFNFDSLNLHSYVERNDFRAFQNYLEAAKRSGCLQAVLEKTDQCQKTVLCLAFEKKRGRFVEAMASYEELDVSRPCYCDSNTKNTALHIAAKNGFFEGIKILVNKKKDQLLKIIETLNEQGLTPLHFAAYYKNFSVMKMFIEELRADVNRIFPDRQCLFIPGQTLFHHFARNNDCPSFLQLIASPHLSPEALKQKDREGSTPLSILLSFRRTSFYCAAGYAFDKAFERRFGAEILKKYPSELLDYIFSFLKRKELSKLSQVSKQWNEVFAPFRYFIRFIKNNSIAELFETPNAFISFLKNFTKNPLKSTVNTLDLSCYPNLSGEELIEIAGCIPEVRELKLKGHAIDDKSLGKALSHFKSLNALHLEKLSLSGKCLTMLASPALLKKLSLNKCYSLQEKYLNQTFPQLNSLKELSISYALHLTGHCLSTLGQLENLSHLELGGCPKFERQALLNFIAKLKGLTTLHLFKFLPVDEEILNAIPTPKNLLFLELIGFRKIHNFTLFFEKLSHLEALSLQDLSISKQDLETLPTIKTLQYLEISSCGDIKFPLQLKSRSFPLKMVEKIHFMSLEQFMTFYEVLKFYQGSEFKNKLSRFKVFSDETGLYKKEGLRMLKYLAISGELPCFGALLGPKGALLGLALAIIVASSGYLYEAIPENREKYIEWKREKRFQVLMHLVKETTKEDPILHMKMKGLVCQLTGEIPASPVMDNDGNLYEEEAILSFIAENNNKGPSGNLLFTHGLEKDLGIHGLILNAFCEVLQNFLDDIEEIQSPDPSKPLKDLTQGIGKLLISLKDLIRKDYQNAKDWAVQAAVLNTISDETKIYYLKKIEPLSLV